MNDLEKLDALIKKTGIMPFAQSNGEVAFMGKGLFKIEEMQKQIDDLMEFIVEHDMKELYQEWRNCN